MFNILEKKPLLNENIIYSSALFKGNYYLFNTSNKKIIVKNIEYKEVGKVKTSNPYKCVYAFKKNNTYLAIKENNKNYIYILDENFNEINNIKLTIPKKYQESINTVYYHTDLDKILISTNNYFYSVSKDGFFIKDELSLNAYKSITHYYKELVSIINLNGNSCCCNIAKGKIRIKAVGYIGCKTYLSYEIENSTYLSEISKSGNIVNTFYIDDYINLETIFEANNKMHLLVTKKQLYSYLYITNLSCSCSSFKNKCNNICDYDYVQNEIDKCLEKYKF